MTEEMRSHTTLNFGRFNKLNIKSGVCVYCEKEKGLLHYWVGHHKYRLCSACYNEIYPRFFKDIKFAAELTNRFKFGGQKKIEEKEIICKQIPDDLLGVLKNLNIFDEITETELDKKIVGEIDARRTIFLCSQGRLVKNCQTASYNLLVNDEAGIGKDYVTSETLAILPKEVYIHKTRISPNVLTYWHNSKFEPNWTWDGKVFYPEDISEQVLNSDVFKVMSSKGSSATILINQIATEIEIHGKPVIITTTASATPTPELTRRFIILNLDSSEKQTESIMKRHSEYRKKGIIPEYDPKYSEAMKYLRRVKVKIPFADLIDKYFPTNNLIMRTNYPRFLDFISASAAFHQYQRVWEDKETILVEGQDYDIARACFLKVCSNRFMIPLTINQKKILAIFEKNPLLSGSVTALHKTMGFMSDRALQTNLQKLVQYGFLEIKVEKDSWNRDIEVYELASSYSPNEKISIPTYKELCKKNSEPSIPSISSEPSIPSLPKEVQKVPNVSNQESAEQNIPKTFDSLLEEINNGK